MNLKKMVCITLMIIIFSGCTINKDKNLTLEPTGDQPMELVKLSSRGPTDQQPSDLIKQYLSNYEEISGVRAVNHDKNILVAVDVDHEDRFALDSLESDVKKKVKQNFSEMNITVSTDEKILLELEELENQIHANDITKEELKKRINKLKKLSKEET